MKPNFSERIGLKNSRTTLERNKLPSELRNSLWNLVFEWVLVPLNNEVDHYSNETVSQVAKFYLSLWRSFFKRPVDEISINFGRLDSNYPVETLRDWYFRADWNEVYEFVEYVVDSDREYLIPAFNGILKREFSAYRFVEKTLVEINSEEEIAEIEKAINVGEKYSPIRTHLAASLNLLSNKKNPDFRNSIKESISAVESLCKIIVEDDSVTLGAALKIIESKHNIPEGLKKGFSAIYGFTSDKGGIRHGLLSEDVVVGVDEARFMVIACSAFINYLISKVD